MEQQQQRDWSGLASHLLDLIAERISFPDLYRFGGVCISWRSVCGILKLKNHLPWLLVPHQEKINRNLPGTLAYDSSKVGFYGICDDKIYKADIPEISNRRICASFKGGWLMTVHGNSEVQLFNPLTTSLLHLPPLTKLPLVDEIVERKEKPEDALPSLFYIGTRCDTPSKKYCYKSDYMRDIYILKVAMSSSSSSIGIGSSSVIMAIAGVESALVFYRIGAAAAAAGDQETTWTPVTMADRTILHHLNDVTFYRGKFYAVHHNGYVVVVHGLALDKEESIGIGHPYVEKVITHHPCCRKSDNQLYILASSGELLLVVRYFNKHERTAGWFRDSLHRTVGFKVLKLQFSNSPEIENKWVEMQSLGDRSIFLGVNSSFSILSTDFSGCKPNCIYFTDDFWGFYNDLGFGGHDLGFCNLQDGSIHQLLYPRDTTLIQPPPLWFAPQANKEEDDDALSD